MLMATKASLRAPGVTNGENLCFLPSARRVEAQAQPIAPHVSVYVLGMDVHALIDTGGSLSLIGDTVFELCRARGVKFRKCSTRLQVANGVVVQARGAVRLRISYASRKCRQRFTYCPGLAVPMILGRDFIVREGLLLDLAGGGYRLGNDAELIPFAASNLYHAKVSRSRNEVGVA